MLAYDVMWHMLRHVGVGAFVVLFATHPSLGNNSCGKYSHGVSQVQVQGMAVPSFMHLDNLWSSWNSSVDIWEVYILIPR